GGEVVFATKSASIDERLRRPAAAGAPRAHAGTGIARACRAETNGKDKLTVKSRCDGRPFAPAWAAPARHGAHPPHRTPPWPIAASRPAYFVSGSA
ncbi:hypothetical protein, partial [Burkholderia glumae]|uniref:hypothetical protein n=1 Tax=Burkholderia glumae TaxID=337 RepID=UPI0019D717ED